MSGDIEAGTHPLDVGAAEAEAGTESANRMATFLMKECAEMDLSDILCHPADRVDSPDQKGECWLGACLPCVCVEGW